MKLLLLFITCLAINSTISNKINTAKLADIEKYLKEQNHDIVIKLAMGCRCFIRYMSFSDEIYFSHEDKQWLLTIAKMNKTDAIRFIVVSAGKYERLNSINNIHSFTVLFQHEIIEVLNLVNKSD